MSGKFIIMSSGVMMVFVAGIMIAGGLVDQNPIVSVMGAIVALCGGAITMLAVELRP